MLDSFDYCKECGKTSTRYNQEEKFYCDDCEPSDFDYPFSEGMFYLDGRPGINGPELKDLILD